MKLIIIIILLVLLIQIIKILLINEFINSIKAIKIRILKQIIMFTNQIRKIKKEQIDGQIVQDIIYIKILKYY